MQIEQKPISTDKEFFTFYILNLSKVILLFSAFVGILKRSWVGEDAFIFFKYVDNFVHGNGLVFNIGERVEGFTAPLWVFLLSFLRAISGYELRPLAIIVGLLLTTMSLVLFLIYFSDSKTFFPLGFVLLVSNSAFRDFSTSGFETSLTYLLLISILILLYKNIYLRYPVLTGILASLLVLNRPESFLVLAYISVLIFLQCLKTKNWADLIKFGLPVAVLLGGYQIFRMGYYASLFPNTFYAKKGGTLYLAQGFNYFKDFTVSYWFTSMFAFPLLVYSIFNKEVVAKTKHFIVLHVLLTSYVLYAGGDYMHGRSLLMSFICLAAITHVSAEYFVSNLKGKIHIDFSVYQITLIVLSFVIFKIGLMQVPITTKQEKQINNIANERSRFGYDFDIKYFKRYVSLPITAELGWAERGYYYRELSKKLGVPFSVVNTNIGYFGYAAGDLVNVMGGSLIDPYIARQPILQRGKIGHENDPEVNYVLSRKPTFAYTPFKYWNEHAHFKWDEANFAYIIKDDSNESYTPVFDLSNKEFLEKFSKLIGKDIKSEIDRAQRDYLMNLPNTEETDDYLGFLSTYWYPYANDSDRRLFEATVINRKIANKYKFDKYIPIWPKVTSKLTSEQFVNNIKFALTKK